MSQYRATAEMSVSPSLTDRIAACLAATREINNPREVAMQYAYRFAAQDGWADAWITAHTSYTSDYNPDYGARGDVISDEMIEAAVDAIFPQGEAGKAPDPTLPENEGGPGVEVVGDDIDGAAGKTKGSRRR